MGPDDVIQEQSHIDYLYERYEACPASIDGHQGCFVQGIAK